MLDSIVGCPFNRLSKVPSSSPPLTVPTLIDSSGSQPLIRGLLVLPKHSSALPEKIKFKFKSWITLKNKGAFIQFCKCVLPELLKVWKH